MRSYDKSTPEELNRVATDHIADVLLVTDGEAVERLAAEGIRSGVHVCGDVMYDLYLQALPRAEAALSPALHELASEPYDLLTLHRGENVDDAARLRAIVAAFAGAPRRAIFPVHPRTRLQLERFGIALPPEIFALEPLGYLEMLALERRASVIFTDSGGVAREAYFASVPCVTLRDRTEWTNTVAAGWNRLAGANETLIRQWVRQPPTMPLEHPALFGDGGAADRIVAALESSRTCALIASARKTRATRASPAAGA
jgi:UDP-GlcNAc3NAcA epimerase